MTKDDVQLLYEYDRWANARVIQAAATLSAEAFTRDLGGSFSSVRDTLLHMLSGEWIWLTYWKEASPSPAFAATLTERRKAQFEPDAFPDLAAVQRKWMDVEKELTEFVESLTEHSLQQQFAVRGAQMPLVHLMQHLANHSTYHRGQVALMMRQLGADPVATDFHLYLAEGCQLSSKLNH
ncbi:MAG TPA: DinB family protein [Candidatus Sulfotelmatobacter sp.]|nr:DinB family protein [Candidatus Sulfotelmatobacter sp.]